MYINKYKAFILFIYILLIPTILFLDIREHGFKYLAIISLFELALFVIGNWKVTGQFFSYSVLFVVLLYVFHFGQVILLGLFPELTKEQQITLLYFQESTCINALFVLNFAFLFVCIGLLVTSKPSIISDRGDTDNLAEAEKLYEKSWTIIFLTFPIKIIIDSIFLFISMRNGLSAGLIFLNSIPDFIVSYSNLVIVGFGSMLVALQFDTKKQKKACVLMILYYVLLMFSGRRSENVAYICILALFFVKSYKKKINIRFVIGISFFAYFFLNFLYAVVASRSAIGNQSVSDIWDTFVYTLNHRNIFVEALREYGNTGYTAVAVIANWLPYYGSNHGLSLLYSFTALVPNIGGWAGQMTARGNFAVQLQRATGVLSNQYLNIGGSLFGELFFNFGIFVGILSCLLLGLFIGWLSRKFDEFFNSGEYYKIAYYIGAYASIIYWIRDRVAGGIRCFVWGAILVYIAKRIVIRGSKE